MEIERAAGITVAVGGAAIALLGCLWFGLESTPPNSPPIVAAKQPSEAYGKQLTNIEIPQPVRPPKREVKPSAPPRTASGESIAYGDPELNSFQNALTQVTTREWRTPGGTKEWSEANGHGLITWNGKPIQEAMLMLLNEIPDSDVRAGWQQIRAENQIAAQGLGDGVCREVFVRQRPKIDDQPESECSQIVIYYAACPLGMSADLIAFCYLSHPWAIRLAEAPLELPYFQRLLEDLQRNGYTLVVRYGVVCAVPIREHNLSNSDPVEIESIQFAKNSQQERDWLEKVPPIERAIRLPDARVQALFSGTSIKVDTSQLKVESETAKANPSSVQFVPNARQNKAEKFLSEIRPYLRTRRDTLAMLLWHRNLTVKQMGDTLVIRSRE